jgi:autotransporter translocation and assembly factor TamB
MPSRAMLSSRLGRKINERIPLLKFDTINYEAKTASSSRAIRVGKRLNDKTYINYRQRFEPRPDENRSEGVLEYELHQNILIEAAGGERGAGTDILWRKRW